MRLKLADFGLALHLEDANNPEEHGEQHRRWCAPEFLGMLIFIVRVQSFWATALSM